MNIIHKKKNKKNRFYLLFNLRVVTDSRVCSCVSVLPPLSVIHAHMGTWQQSKSSPPSPPGTPELRCSYQRAHTLHCNHTVSPMCVCVTQRHGAVHKSKYTSVSVVRVIRFRWHLVLYLPSNSLQLFFPTWFLFLQRCSSLTEPQRVKLNRSGETVIW